MKFRKGDFILPTAFPCTNRVLLNNLDAPNNLKTIFESTRTILEKAHKVPVPENIKATLNTQIVKIKNTSINLKSLTFAHENFFLYDNENMITETYMSENSSIYGLIACLGKTTNEDNKLHLIMPEHKLNFNLKRHLQNKAQTRKSSHKNFV